MVSVCLGLSDTPYFDSGTVGTSSCMGHCTITLLSFRFIAVNPFCLKLFNLAVASEVG